MNKVFVDSGAWISCINKDDKYHKKAFSYLKELRQNNISLFTSNYVKAETLTWLKYNTDHQKAIKAIELWEKAERKQQLKTCWVTKKINKEAEKILKKYKDHNLSITDCTSFAICRNFEIQKVFSFDNDFNILGFLLAPYQIKEENNINYNVLYTGNSPEQDESK